MKRFLIEVIVAAVLILAVIGVWWWKEGQQTAALEQQREAHQVELDTLRERAGYWATVLADSEAEAVFRSFAAGITPTVLSGRRDALEQAVTQLISLSAYPGSEARRGAIAFIHLLAPDGEVITSSDLTFVSEGNAAERGAWAMGAVEVVTRTSTSHEGVTEVAGPILGTDGPSLVVWLGYRTGQLKEKTMPALLGEG